MQSKGQRWQSHQTVRKAKGKTQGLQAIRSRRKKKHVSKTQILLAAARKFRLHPADNRRVIESFFIALGSAVALSCYMLYKHGEFEQLVKKEIDPSQYIDYDRFRDDFCAVNFLRKHAHLATGINTEKVAIDGFREAEEHCRQTNGRIRIYLRTGKTDPTCHWLLNATIGKIDKILGSFSIEEVIDECNWGPGVTQAVKGSDTSGTRKFDIERGITRDAYALFGDAFSQAYPTWEVWKGVPSFSEGNHIITVPKNAKTDRTIAVEPGLNTWIQLGIGKSIRRRLRYAGFDLNHDSKNQRGAYIGSVDDSLATVDFKQASDTISREVVELLLPHEWFVPMNAARSHYYSFDKGKTWTLAQKFSTMGNGFTFEMESLIFVAAALAVCERRGLPRDGISIFGDDLIIPSEAVSEYNHFVNWLGFKVNSDKTFASGLFRESCGSYYFDGYDVKPFYLKKDLQHVKDLFRMANAVRALAHRYRFTCGCDIRFRATWLLVCNLCPKPLRLWGPVTAGDACLHGTLSEASPSRSPHGWDGWNYAGLPEIPKSHEVDSLGLLLSRLHRPSGDMPYGNKVPFRARTRMVYKTAMFVHQWYDFGLWL